MIKPSIEAKLNENQRKIMKGVILNGSVTTSWCIENLGIVKDTTRRYFNELIELGFLKRVGKGRGVKYILNENDR